MTRPRRARRAWLGLSAGVVTAAVGLGIEVGYGWGLVLFGVVWTVLFLLGYDVDGGGGAG